MQEEKPRSVILRIRRVIQEDAYIAVPVKEKVMEPGGAGVHPGVGRPVAPGGYGPDRI